MDAQFYENIIENSVRMSGSVLTLADEAAQVCGYESDFYYYVKSGNVRRIMTFMEDNGEFTALFPMRCRKSASAATVRAAALITIARGAAIDSGCNIETSYSISELYSDRLGECRNFNDVADIVRKCAIELTDLSAGLLERRCDKYCDLVNKCISHILERMPGKVTLQELADSLCVTPKYLSTLFNRETGMSISAFMQSIRIEQAENMLVNTNLSYSDISNLLCFDSQSYFNQIFKSHAGVTPREYRARSKRNPQGSTDQVFP